MSTQPTRREVAPLIGRRRQLATDDSITDFDYVNDDGDKIKKISRRRPEGGYEEVEINKSKIYATTPSTTNNTELLVIEAGLVADGKDVGNPHIPATDAVLNATLDRLAEHDLDPAWGVDG